jgi:hypothetical protein
LLDLGPDHEVGACGGSNDGKHADGEDADEFDTAALLHGGEVQEEDYWKGPAKLISLWLVEVGNVDAPYDNVSSEIVSCIGEPEGTRVVALRGKDTVEVHLKDVKGPSVGDGVAGKDGGDYHGGAA